MTDLTQHLIAHIKRAGPITIAEYMTQCLMHPRYGYYTNRMPFGKTGDFITAPEISQMFGELIGAWVAQIWIDQNKPTPFTLVELGPGRGTLMADALRTTKTVPGFHEAVHITLLEVSEPLRQEQKKTLAGYEITWIETIDELPEHPCFIIANEFFDCLPIQQFVRTKDGWQERMIGVENDALGFILGSQKPADFFGAADISAIFEVSKGATAITSEISRKINENSGALLIIDYGDWAPKKDTLQAVKNHQKIDPLYDCGRADLTAHVNFKSLAKAAAPFARVSPLTSQGVFLERLGIITRAQILAQTLEGHALETHITSHRRLTHPNAMGNLFKVLAVTPNDKPPPPGFDP